MVTILYTNSTDISKKKTLDELLKQLPVSMLERAKRYKFEQDAYNFVLGRLLLGKGLGLYNLASSLLTEIYYNKEGKPLLKDIYFSIAHSQDLVACAITFSGKIGLDVEFARSIVPKHFRHCFTDKEWAKIGEDEGMDTFYKYWTQKEAILKANGLGLSYLMDIELLSDKKAIVHKGKELVDWSLETINFTDLGVYACLCSEKQLEVKLQKVISF